MKLQRRFTRKVGKTEYVKWVLTIPPKLVEMLGWKEGEELEGSIDANTLLIKKVANHKGQNR